MEYGPITVGVFIGAVAHFGSVVGDEKTPLPSLRVVLGFLMQLAMVGLVAAVAAEKFDIASRLMQCLMAAILSVATVEIVRWLRGKATGIVAKLASGSDIGLDGQ